MKRVIAIIAIIGALIVVVLGGNYFLNFETPDYVKEYTEVVQQKEEPKEEVKELDLIEKAGQELERINAELDTEEAKLLEDKKAIETRLEKLRETRASFQ